MAKAIVFAAVSSQFWSYRISTEEEWSEQVFMFEDDLITCDQLFRTEVGNRLGQIGGTNFRSGI